MYGIFIDAAATMGINSLLKTSIKMYMADQTTAWQESSFVGPLKRFFICCRSNIKYGSHSHHIEVILKIAGTTNQANIIFTKGSKNFVLFKKNKINK
jgi:hypothetical protein